MNADKCKKVGETMASPVLNTKAVIARRRLLAEHRRPTETISVHECSLAVRALHFAQNQN